MSRIRRLAAALAAAALSAAAAVPLVAIWAAPAAAQPAPKTTDIVNFTYNPLTLTVPAGTTVTFKNTADRPHTATDRGGTFDTRPILPGQSKAITFSAPGRYFYFCRINPSKMNGEVVVEPGSGEVKSGRIQALDPARDGAKLSFDPADLSLPAGSALVFANVGGKPHTLTADDGSFDTGVVTPGAEQGRFAGHNAVLTLAKPGRFPFHCEIHPAAMKGVLTVTGEAPAQSAAPVSNAPRTLNVAMKDFAFDKPEASVAPGGKVTWTNTGGAPHTATFDDVAFDTGTITPGTKGELTAPDKPGSYSYKCSIHPAKMRGVLVVVGENTGDPTAAGTPVAAAAPPPAAATGGGGGPGSGLSSLVLVTGVLGGFLGGFGISAFVNRRRTAAS
jgi:plastocyanin